MNHACLALPTRLERLLLSCKFEKAKNALTLPIKVKLLGFAKRDQRHDFVCTFNWRTLDAKVTIQSDSSRVCASPTN